MAHNNLGDALDDKGQIEEAIRPIPGSHSASNQIFALACIQPGQRPAQCKAKSRMAIRQYQEAIRLKPDFADAHNNLGGAFGKKRQTDEAIRQFQEAIRLEPDSPSRALQLGQRPSHERAS